jgi:hypothetical protein
MGACIAKPKVQKEGSRDSSQFINAEANILHVHDSATSPLAGAQGEVISLKNVSPKTITVSLPGRIADKEPKKNVMRPRHSNEQLQKLSTPEILEEYRRDATSLRNSVDRTEKVSTLYQFIL